MAIFSKVTIYSLVLKKTSGVLMLCMLFQQVFPAFLIVVAAQFFMSSLDASKAFDRVNHGTVITKLLDRGVPTCLINVITNWYSKLSAAVRWNGVFTI